MVNELLTGGLEACARMELTPEPEQTPAAVDTRAMFRLCNVYGFPRAAAMDALRGMGDVDEALATLLSELPSGPRDSILLGAGGTSSEAAETQTEELEALAAIFDDAFSRPTDRRSEIRLQRDEPPLVLTLSVLATEAYPKKPPLVALSAEKLLPATNLCLTEALVQRAIEMTQDDDESVKIFELCSWVTEELDASLLVDPREGLLHARSLFAMQLISQSSDTETYSPEQVWRCAKTQRRQMRGRMHWILRGRRRLVKQSASATSASTPTSLSSAMDP